MVLSYTRLALFTQVVNAMFPWDSDSQKNKTKNDEQELKDIGQRVNQLNAVAQEADTYWQGNRSILGLLQNQVREGRAQLAASEQRQAVAETAHKLAYGSFISSAQAVDAAKEHMFAAQAALSTALGQKYAAGNATAGAQQALVKARAAQQAAQQTVNADLAAGGQVLGASLEKLKAAQQDTALAENRTRDADEKYKAAQESAEEARRHFDDVNRQLSTIKQSYHAAEEREREAQQTSEDASKALVASQSLHKWQQTAKDDLLAKVNSLEEDKRAKFEALARAAKHEEELPGIIAQDKQCFSDLSNGEKDLAAERQNWDKTLDLYDSFASNPSQAGTRQDVKNALWSIRDNITDIEYKLNGIQRDCAPMQVSQMTPPAKCNVVTGGTCSYFPCYAFRRALCVDGKCVCSEAACTTSEGKCEARGSPMPFTTPPLSELDVKPKTGQFELVALIMVVVAILVASAIRRRQRQEVKLFEVLLG